MIQDTMETKQEYNLSKKERKIITAVYEDVDLMIGERNKTRKQFNNRTLIAYINDSEKRFNGYVPTRESQDKKAWQANVFMPSTRNKLKAMIAAVALTVPVMKFRAVGNDGGLDLKRAEMMKELVRHSYYQANPEMEVFFDAWEAAGKGTVIKYEGYLRTKYKRKFVTSYDLATGEVESEEKEVNVDDKCVELDVPLSEFYVKDYFITDVQRQPSIAWIKYLDKTAAETEFGQYKNWKYVPVKPRQRFEGESSTFFYDKWTGRTAEDEYEVISYYNKFEDQYNIIINGVPMLLSPMLWGKKDKKYPFAKTLFEPFNDRHFFYGNSLPNSVMGQQDVLNQLVNMGLDKTYRSMNPPLLASLGNKDLLETENEGIGMETTLYVDDINQVQYQDIQGVTSPEMAMLELISKGIDLTTVDANQQGVAGRGVTAREIVIANENAQKLKGIFFMFLKDLWIQKTKLRILNILMNYTQPIVNEIVGAEKGKDYQDRFRTFNIENSDFSNGEKGILSIQMVGKQQELPTMDSLAEEEAQWRETGENYQKVAITSDYLDNYDYDVQIISNDIAQKNAAEAQALALEKVQTIASLFPQLFLLNQPIFFKELIRAYGEPEEKYAIEMPQGQPEGAEQGAGQPTPKGQAKPQGLTALPKL